MSADGSIIAVAGAGAVHRWQLPPPGQIAASCTPSVKGRPPPPPLVCTPLPHILSDTTKLMLSPNTPNPEVSGVCWAHRGTRLAVATFIMTFGVADGVTGQLIWTNNYKDTK